jgi:16S rRNA processing protein RimM
MTFSLHSLDTADLPADAVAVGRILGPWGIKGWVKVMPYSAAPEALFSSKRWLIQAPSTQSTAPSAKLKAAAQTQDSAYRLLPIAEAKEHTGSVVARSLAVPDRTAAEALKGAEIFVSRASFPTPDTDEYYWVDLLGLGVSNREGVNLGVVTDLLHTGPQTVLVIQQAAPLASSDTPTSAEKAAVHETLIPFVSAYIDTVDLAGKRITVDWPWGAED